ncbi:hypothetical protein SHO565_59560 [Streptomyces sp. HO565]
MSLTDAPWAREDANAVRARDVDVYAGSTVRAELVSVAESVRQMTLFSSVTITATVSMSMKRASSGLTSIR